MNNVKNIKREILELTAGRCWADLHVLLGSMPAPDVSDLIEELDETHRIVALRLLDLDR